MNFNTVGSIFYRAKFLQKKNILLHNALLKKVNILPFDTLRLYFKIMFCPLFYLTIMCRSVG